MCPVHSNIILFLHWSVWWMLDYKIQLSDLDIVNHANNVKYLEWCLNTMDRKFVLKQHIKGFEMNFLKELSLHDEIEIQKLETEHLIQFKIINQEKVNFVCRLELR